MSDGVNGVSLTVSGKGLDSAGMGFGTVLTEVTESVKTDRNRHGTGLTPLSRTVPHPVQAGLTAYKPVKNVQ